ncbi:MAG: sulfotransferase [Litoreibacter sp.]
MSITNTLRLVKKRLTGTSKPALITPTQTPKTFSGYCFVAGMHRSGTTLVEHLLAARADVATLRANVPENEGQHLQDVVPAGRDHGGPGRFAFSPQMHTAPVDAQSAQAQRLRLLQCWTPWLADDGQFLLEKSPPNLVRIPWLRSIFPGARFLIVTRHPVANAAATQKWSKTSIPELMLHWHVAHSAALQAAKAAQDCCFLRYEDLCDDPTGSIDRVIQKLELPLRQEERTLEPRFMEIKNSNEAYLADQPDRNWGPGAWDHLGYGSDGQHL